ncbi:MAG: hypothetical protein WBA23_16530 [Tunicatimonas sp.]|uniref:hypothetical protein n=1 Tax=Tunicatimonas sp. TaxID=1940096 RepID=UPI003C757578
MILYLFCNFTQLPTKTKVILLIQAAGMLGGTSTHLYWVIRHGFFSEAYHSPLFSVILWDSLTFLDPIAAVLLIVKPRVGVWLTAIIISIDVFHNSIPLPLLSPRPLLEIWPTLFTHWMIISQVAFLIFVLATFRGNLLTIKLSTKGEICSDAN